MDLLFAAEDEDLDKQMGELGSEEPEHLDRNMWAPEEDEEEEKVSTVHFHYK